MSVSQQVAILAAVGLTVNPERLADAVGGVGFNMEQAMSVGLCRLEGGWLAPRTA